MAWTNHTIEATMGGKRPDQHNIDPAAGSSTNSEWRGEGRSADEHIMDEDKQHLQSNPHGQPMIPKTGSNPAARELQGRNASGKQTREPNHSSDEKLDEVLKESFPASDPPAQP